MTSPNLSHLASLTRQTSDGLSVTRQTSTPSDGLSTPRFLRKSLENLEQGLERAGSLNFPFHTPLNGDSVTDERASLRPQDQEADGLTEPLLGSSLGDGADTTEDQPCSRSQELKRLLGLAIPLYIQSIGYMLMVLVSTTFVGHLNDPMILSAVVLASSLYNVLGSSLMIGLVSGMETLAGQAYGAKNYPMLGVVYQRAQLICCTIIAPIALLFYHIKPVLLALGQHPDIAEIAAQYLRILIPSLFLTMINETTRKYLLAQRVVTPYMFCSIFVTCLSPVYNYVYMYRLNLGARGAALAVVSCSATNALLITSYRLYRDLVMLRGAPEQTWHGYSLEAFRGWGVYLSYGVPAAAMICLEWWVWELMIFMAGLLPTASTAVGVMGLAMNISGISYMIPSSMGSATSTRVANSLGAGLAKAAETIAKMAVASIFFIMLLLAGLTYLLRRQVVYIFTEDQTVVEETAVVVPAVAASLIGDGMVAVISGVLRACGRQTLGVTMNLVGYWGIGLPLAYVLGFKMHLGVLGFWISLAASAGLQAIAFVVAVLQFDWPLEVRRAKALTAKHTSVGDLLGLDKEDVDEEQPLLAP